MSDVPFALSSRDVDADTSVITLEGDLDLSSAPQLRHALQEKLAAGHTRLVLDLSLVRFIDSTGLGVLVGAERQLGDAGGIAIVGSGRRVQNLLEVTGLDYTFQLFPTVEAAVSNAARRAPTVQPVAPTGKPSESAAQTPALETEASVQSPTSGSQAARLPLSGDAAVALGIAASAMPFADSTQDEARR
jgi:anti-sigma B factor antagonist